MQFKPNKVNSFVEGVAKNNNGNNSNHNSIHLTSLSFQSLPKLKKIGKFLWRYSQYRELLIMPCHLMMMLE